MKSGMNRLRGRWLSRLQTISSRLTLNYAAIFILVLVLLNIATLQGVRFFLYRQAADQIQDTMDMVLDQINESDRERSDLADKELVLAIPSNDNIYVKIVDARGRTINESLKFNLRIPERIPLQTKKVALIKSDLLSKTRRIVLKDGEFVYLQVIKSLHNVRGFLRVLFYLILVTDLAGIFISLLVGYIISRQMLRPLHRITDAAQSISIHDLNQRIETHGPEDELTRLAQTFNAMIERLQKSFQQQNQFVADASHELRTPIAVIQGYINLLDRWGKADKAIVEEAITVIKNETASMGELLERLLFLARGDSGVLAINKEACALDELIEEVVKETRLIAGQHRISIGSNPAILFHGDRRLIKQMLRALIDNSIKFTPAPGEIRVSAIREQERVQMTVADDGIGIPAAELPRICDRFYQVDRARLRSGAGSGLGLAIVKWIADCHGGELQIQSEVGQGTRITITLPLSSIGQLS